MSTVELPKSHGVWPRDKPVAVVLIFQVCSYKTASGSEFAEVPQQVMHEAFEGEGAKRRAIAFMESERDRDFTARNGWQWMVWANKPAAEEWSKWITDQLCGPEPLDG
jgi:hypothetical protein